FTDVDAANREALDEWLASHLASGPFHKTPKLKKVASVSPAQAKGVAARNGRASGPLAFLR
ncbi:MAG TPA: hypothetical protein VHL05_11655, partial [Terriglobales bacterium]|nr:hypothetical protein [Terriglobales bacterium]